MHSPAPCTIASEVLARRLRELAGEERDVQVEFLLHLAEFDHRRAFLEAGYESLWNYCLRALHLREGPTARRIAAMRVLRRFPQLEPALRDGRLCLSTVTLLGPLLTEENLSDLVRRAAYRTKVEVEHLVATLQPRIAPTQGIRKLPQCDSERSPRDSAERPDPCGEGARAVDDAESSGVLPGLGAAQPALIATSSGGEPPAMAGITTSPSSERCLADPASPNHARSSEQSASDEANEVLGSSAGAERRVPHGKPEVRPISVDEWSLRVTIDAETKAGIETLAALLSHTVGGDLAKVIREAVRCGLEKHGRRKGAANPSRGRPSKHGRGFAGSAARARHAPKSPSIAASSVAATHGSAVSAENDENVPSEEPRATRGLPADRFVSRPEAVGNDAGIPEQRLHDLGERRRATTSTGATTVAGATSRPQSRSIPADVRRQVWQRDHGACTWTAKNGQRCGSRWKLEIDHIQPAALGGPATVENLRVLCRAHNILHAQQVFGRRHMARFSGSPEPCGTNRVAEHSRGRALGSSWTSDPGGRKRTPGEPDGR